MRDDDEHDHVYGPTTVRRPPRPAPSGQTMVGLGAQEVHHERSETPTPPSGMSALLAHSDVAIILERIRAAENKIDALIRDGRGDHAKLDGARRELRALRAYTVRMAQHAEQHARELDEIRGQLLTIAGTLGRPPQRLDERVSQQGELTKEQLIELEQGTGLAGTVGRLAAGQKRLERRVGIAAALGSIAASSPSWAPSVVDAITKLFGGH